MTTENERKQILALAGEPTAWVHRNAQGKLLIAETKPSWDETVWPPVFTADQVLAARKPLEDEIEQLEDERDEAERGPWQEWAELALKIVRKHSGHDGFDDMDGVDLPTELSEALDEYESEVKRLRQQLAAAQAQIVGYLDALENLTALVRGDCPSLLNEDSGGNSGLSMQIDDVLARQPTKHCTDERPCVNCFADQGPCLDTSALEAMIAKAGEVMRERIYLIGGAIGDADVNDAIRDLPGVTLEDLQK